MAGIGAVSMKMGSSARTERWWMRARGVSPWSFTACSPRSAARRSASLIWLATAAVTRPPSTSVGSERIFSQFGSRGPSSNVRPSSGAISRLEAALGTRARSARSWDSTANSSMSSREMSHFSAISSAPRNCDDLLVAVALLPARRTRENGSREPYCLARQHRRR